MTENGRKKFQKGGPSPIGQANRSECPASHDGMAGMAIRKKEVCEVCVSFPVTSLAS